MAHFYGNLRGNKGEATRCGTRSSGIQVSARSWDGSVTVRMAEGPDGLTRILVQSAPESAIGGADLFYGTLDEFRAKLTGRA